MKVQNTETLTGVEGRNNPLGSTNQRLSRPRTEARRVARDRNGTKRTWGSNEGRGSGCFGIRLGKIAGRLLHRFRGN